MTVAVNGAEVSVIRAVADLIGEGLVATGAPVEVPTRTSEGERSLGWLLVEPDHASVADPRCAVIGCMGEIHAVGKLSLVSVYLGTFDVKMPPWAWSIAQAEWGRQRAQEALEQKQEALRMERDLWAQRLDTAHEWAIARNHCSEYEDIMDVLGLPGRERDFGLDLTVSIDVRVVLAAQSGDRAQENLTDREIAEVISNMSHAELVGAINDHTVEDVEAA